MEHFPYALMTADSSLNHVSVRKPYQICTAHLDCSGNEIKPEKFLCTSISVTLRAASVGL